jgi:hypothetical protein
VARPPLLVRRGVAAPVRMFDHPHFIPDEAPRVEFVSQEASWAWFSADCARELGELTLLPMRMLYLVILFAFSYCLRCNNDFKPITGVELLH